MNVVLLKRSGRIEDFQASGYGRLKNIEDVNMFVLIEKIHQIFCQRNVREIFARNSFSVGPGCE